MSIVKVFVVVGIKLFWDEQLSLDSKLETGFTQLVQHVMMRNKKGVSQTCKDITTGL